MITTVNPKGQVTIPEPRVSFDPIRGYDRAVAGQLTELLLAERAREREDA
ncbi:MAG: hypothetical protein ACYCV7_12805 [Acidimicrobiales bacterium]